MIDSRPHRGPSGSEVDGRAAIASAFEVRHERRNWFKWITGKAEDLAEVELVATQPVASNFTDNDILAALDQLPAHSATCC